MISYIVCGIVIFISGLSLGCSIVTWYIITFGGDSE